MRTKAQATKARRALLKQMRGKNWKLDVWENIGWHYAVANKSFRVHPDREVGFTAYPNILNGLVCSPTSSPDPNLAVAQLLRQAVFRINCYTSAITLAKWEIS